MLSTQLLAAAANQPTSGGWYDTVLYPFKWVTAWVLVGIHKGLTVLGLPEGPGAVSYTHLTLPTKRIV